MQSTTKEDVEKKRNHIFTKAFWERFRISFIKARGMLVFYFPMLYWDNKFPKVRAPAWRWFDCNIEFILVFKDVRRLSLSFQWSNNDEHLFSFNFALPWLFSFWFNVSIPDYFGLVDKFVRVPRYEYGKYNTLELGIRIWREMICLDFFKPTMDSSLTKWFSWDKAWFVDDIFLGKYETKEEVVKTIHDLVVDVPEQPGYSATQVKLDVKIERFTRVYHRFYVKDFEFHRTEYTVTNPEDAPMRQGKGENSWDCEPEKILGCSVPGVLTDYEVKQKYLEQVVEERKRYG